MALYLGSSEQLKIYLGDILCHLNLYSEIPITNNKDDITTTETELPVKE